MDRVCPRYPLYIVSKKRADTRFTSNALEEMRVPYYIVVEQDDYDDYAAVIDPKKILILPEHYFDDYDVFDKLGRTKSTGPGPARNFVWDHSTENGFDRHWVMDDNIKKFSRFNHNLIRKVTNGTVFRAMEDFCDRYQNIAMAGPAYEMFVVRKILIPPFITNTRIYSCNLIKNNTPYRWRGRYNEDTDLSIRMLKDKWCTVQFNAFLQLKMPTQKVQGGNTGDFYNNEGTLPKSKMQVDMHPDISRITWRFNRIHHHVDYSGFKKNKLVKKDDVDISTGVDNFGMRLTSVKPRRSNAK